MSQQYLTQEKYDELKSRLFEMKSDGRKEVAARLKAAKALGDLSENADYQEVREQQAMLERQIWDIEEILRESQIIEKRLSSSQVEIGSTVKLMKDEEEFASFTIVGSHEAKPLNGLISNESPIGKLLLGKKVGDVVRHNTKKGAVQYKIMEIK